MDIAFKGSSLSLLYFSQRGISTLGIKFSLDMWECKNPLISVGALLSLLPVFLSRKTIETSY